MTRRELLLAVAGLLSVPAPSLPAASLATRIDLWPARPPGGGGPDGAVEISARGAMRHIATPLLEVFAPEQANGAAVLVAGGGGYRRIQMGSEARPAARWLAARGITAFVLRYRLPGEGWNAGALAPLQDAQRALRLIRARAAQYGLDPLRLSVLGFSAGAHLLGLAAMRADFRAYPPVDALDALSARPAAAALIYPVMTLQPPYQHTATRRVLLGAHADAARAADWSVQTHVRAGCPPVFLVQADDDPVADPHNSALLAQACEAAGVAVEWHRLPSGGHGFGMGRAGTPTADWPVWYAAWLRRTGLIA